MTLLTTRTPGEVCGAAAVVPNILHRVWVGDGCPPAHEFVSFLVALLMLRPDEAQLHVSEVLAPVCRVGRASIDVAQFFTSLGAKVVYHNFTSGAIARATRDFKLRLAYDPTKRHNIAPERRTDVVRAFLTLTVGGYYLDGDVLVLSPDLAAWRACPITIAANFIDFKDEANASCTGAACAPPPLEWPFARPGELARELNTAMTLSVPNTSFSRAQWHMLRGWSGTHLFTLSCCAWPMRYEQKHPTELIGAATMRVFPFRIHRQPFAEEGQWAATLDRLIARNATAAHLTNFHIRHSTGQVRVDVDVDTWTRG